MAEIINIQTLVTAIFVAVPTSLLSVYLALRRYRTEKWWDRKAECYIETVNSMNDIIRFCDGWLSEELDGKEIADPVRDELEREFHSGKMVIEVQTNIGNLLMCEEAHKDLLALDRALFKAEREEDIVQQIAGIRVETENCLCSFILHAKSDLGVHKL